MPVIANVFQACKNRKISNQLHSNIWYFLHKIDQCASTASCVAYMHSIVKVCWYFKQNAVVLLTMTDTYTVDV